MNSDFSTCETEPIHAPGSIQPFGVLLALDAKSLTVRHTSQNSQDVFGPGAVTPLGATAAEVLGPAAASAIRNGLAEDRLIAPRPIPVSIPGTSANRWHGVAHCLADVVFVEVEPADEKTASPIDLLSAVRFAVGRLAAAVTVSEFVAAVAREVRSMTGYNRVMVYRFDAEWNGEVIAEERDPDLEPFLGLHYPASDIPAQARALFLANTIRVIPDAALEPIPVIPAINGGTGLPLDLSRCLLRSPAPVHREYLHNMGVRASLTASLTMGGRLWGLIACHHATPRRPSPAEREACDLLAQVASVHVAFLADAEDRGYAVKLGEALGRTGTRIGATMPPIAALAKDPADLLGLVGASGAIVWRSGHGMPIGTTPPAEALPGLIDWIKRLGTPFIATDRLSQVYPAAQAFADEASGLLAVEVSSDADEYLLWFRPPIIQSVNWAGNPRDKPVTDGRMTPRRSFAIWTETVQNRSLPWRPAEVNNAREVNKLLMIATAQSAGRMEALLPICAWCKKVRDEPDYWRGVEEFIHDLVDVRFTHGICPGCLSKQMAEFTSPVPS